MWYRRTRGLILKKHGNFSGYFECHNSLYVFVTPRFYTIKLCSPVSFSYKKHVERLSFQNKRIVVWQQAFGARKFLETFEKQVPGFIRFIRFYFRFYCEWSSQNGLKNSGPELDTNPDLCATRCKLLHELINVPREDLIAASIPQDAREMQWKRKR